jgi:hypothetical protein
MLKRLFFTGLLAISTNSFAGLDEYLDQGDSSRIDDHMTVVGARIPPEGGEGTLVMGAAIDGKPTFEGGGGARRPPTEEEAANADENAQKEMNLRALDRLLDSVDNFFNNLFGRTSLEVTTGKTTRYFDKEGNLIREDQGGSCVSFGAPGTCKKLISQRIGNTIVLKIVPLHYTAIKKRDGTIVYKYVTYTHEYTYFVINARTGPALQEALIEKYIFEEIETFIVLDFKCENGKAAGEYFDVAIPHGTQTWQCNKQGLGYPAIMGAECTDSKYELDYYQCVPRSCDGEPHGTRIFVEMGSSCVGTRIQWKYKKCSYGRWIDDYETHGCGNSGEGGGGGGRGPGYEEPPPIGEF